MVEELAKQEAEELRLRAQEYEEALYEQSLREAPFFHGQATNSSHFNEDTRSSFYESDMEDYDALFSEILEQTSGRSPAQAQQNQPHAEETQDTEMLMD
jgi:hypothetical protein